MTGLDIVRQAKGIDGQIERFYERLQQITSRVEGTAHEVSLTGVKSKSGTNRDKIGDYLSMVEKYQTDIDSLEDIRIKALQVIMTLEDPEEQQVIEDYYLRSMSCQKIADCMNYSRPYISKKKTSAEIALAGMEI